IVSQRDTFHGGEDGDQGAVNAARLSSEKLRDIGILLLRHNAASRAVGVVDLHETVLIGIPEDDLLGKTAEMHHHCGKRREKLDHIISVRYGIHTVPCRTVKTK